MTKTVLIVDDDDILRNTLARGLRNDGFYILTANSAENATDVLNRISVDSIVFDRMMTGMDGLSFLKQLRASGNQTPTIMLTAMTGPENAIDGLSGGANDYLAKPFQIRELILRLNNIIKPTNITMPTGLAFINNDFFATAPDTGEQKLLTLSGEEKKLLHSLTHPIGNIVSASPMVAKRLRNKLNVVLSTLDIITIRGQGYKLIDLSADNQKR
ncbi:MAG: response regulator transcription factor [Alphaproteobacteria bacterium]|nr:response regulator transcription factor [Alphaproteobacteria bacterium]